MVIKDYYLLILYHRTINLWPKKDTNSSPFHKSSPNPTKYLHSNLKENMAHIVQGAKDLE